MKCATTADHEGYPSTTAIGFCSSKDTEDMMQDTLVASGVWPSTNHPVRHSRPYTAIPVGCQWQTTGGCPALFSASGYRMMDKVIPSDAQKETEVIDG
jgi:hypothetical protein